ncbi:unnamed protein product [Meloidogyne enterolobii]|uniref:Uncharacterized protein n=1 Tax=Meloidogyne enterolobii TaxID=390850 RepID=A0ACB0Z4V6_MELEN
MTLKLFLWIVTIFSFINYGITDLEDSKIPGKTLAQLLHEKESNEGSDHSEQKTKTIATLFKEEENEKFLKEEVSTKKDYGNQGNLKSSLKKENGGREKKIKKVNFQHNIATYHEAIDPKDDNMPEVYYKDPPFLYENDEKDEEKEEDHEKNIKKRENYLKLSVDERLKKYSKNIAPLEYAVNLLKNKEKQEKLAALIGNKKFNQILKKFQNKKEFLALKSSIEEKLETASTNKVPFFDPLKKSKSQKKYLDDLVEAGYLRLLFAVELCSKIEDIYKNNTEDKDYMKKYCADQMNKNFIQKFYEKNI